MLIICNMQYANKSSKPWSPAIHLLSRVGQDHIYTVSSLVCITKALNLEWLLNLWERDKPQNKPSKKGLWRNWKVLTLKIREEVGKNTSKCRPCIYGVYGIFGREITKYMVIYGVYIQLWPTPHKTLVLCCQRYVRAHTHAHKHLNIPTQICAP